MIGNRFRKKKYTGPRKTWLTSPNRSTIVDISSSVLAATIAIEIPRQNQIKSEN
jgi:hypothetical protein